MLVLIREDRWQMGSYHDRRPTTPDRRSTIVKGLVGFREALTITIHSSLFVIISPEHLVKKRGIRHLCRIATAIKHNEQGGGARGARTLLHTCLPLQYGARGHYYIHVYLYNDIMIIVNASRNPTSPLNIVDHRSSIVDQESSAVDRGTVKRRISSSRTPARHLYLGGMETVACTYAVGDARQRIYRWRGASEDCIRRIVAYGLRMNLTLLPNGSSQV